MPQKEGLKQIKERLNYWVQQIIQMQQRLKDYHDQQFGIRKYFIKREKKQ